MGRAARLLHRDDLVEDLAERPERYAPRSITMSISSAPASTASATSSNFTFSEARPEGKAVATEATLTGEPPQNARARVPPGRDRRRRRRRCGTSLSAGRADAPWCRATSLAQGVRALERREIDHGDGQIQGGQLRRFLDGARGQLGGSRLGTDRVHAGQSPEQCAQLRFGLDTTGRDAGPATWTPRSSAVTRRSGAILTWLNASNVFIDGPNETLAENSGSFPDRRRSISVGAFASLWLTIASSERGQGTFRLFVEGVDLQLHVGVERRRQQIGQRPAFAGHAETVGDARRNQDRALLAGRRGESTSTTPKVGEPTRMSTITSSSSP